MTFVLILASVLSSNVATAEKVAPKMNLQLRPACEGVWQEFFGPQDWNVEILESRFEDEELPSRFELHQFVSSIKGLDRALADKDDLQLGVFYARMHSWPLHTISKRYSTVSPQILKQAKLKACANTLGRT